MLHKRLFARLDRLRRHRRRRLTFDQLEQRIVLHGSLAGSVFVDADRDGARDTNEAGVPGVVVQLSGTTASSTVNDSILTDNNGAFAFTGLEPGTYELTERQPAAVFDGLDSTLASGAVAANDRISNIVLAEDQAITGNNFGELSVRPEFVNVTWFFASAANDNQLFRRMVAAAEELAGNTALAIAIRTEGQVPTEPTIPTDPGDNGTGPFAPVTTGPFDAPNLLGIRTDLQPGAPPITQTHVSTAIDYSGYSNPPTYGPHHGVVLDAQNRSITPRPTGVYTTPQPDEDLIHNLEHGHVWISYNPSLLSAADRTALEQFVRAGGVDNGVILTPRPQNTTAIALASWAHLQTLNNFNAAQIREFVETNRGHAPEGFIPSGQKNDSAASETLDDGLLHTQTQNQPFGPVTPGSVDDPNLRGTRTDTLPSAPPVSQTHLTTAIDYTGYSNPPSYGPHHGVVRDAQNNFITPRPTGVYTTPQPDEDLIHNLEHGHVWISYNPTMISDTDRTAIEQLVTAGGVDTGVIVTPRPKNSSPIVLTSWTRQMTLNSFNAATIRDFILVNRGHAPEGFIPSGQKPANGETLDDGLPHTP